MGDHMSKIATAKIVQQYKEKAHLPVCGNCANYLSTIEEIPSVISGRPPYTNETKRRCGIGGFAIKKMGTCSLFTEIK